MKQRLLRCFKHDHIATFGLIAFNNRILENGVFNTISIFINNEEIFLFFLDNFNIFIPYFYKIQCLKYPYTISFKHFLMVIFSFSISVNFFFYLDSYERYTQDNVLILPQRY